MKSAVPSKILTLFLIGVMAVVQGCKPACETFHPVISCQLPSLRIETMPSPFLPPNEKEGWASELRIGDAFARESDFYRAITSYKRSLILLPPEKTDRKLQLEYDLIFCYYLGNKPQEALNIFETGSIAQADPTFPAFNQLLLMIYDCYLQTHQEEKGACVLQAIERYSSESAEDLSLYKTLKEGDIQGSRDLIAGRPDREEIMQDFALYDQFAKSPAKARALNALLPGAGYYYVGEKKSAMTSFLINTLFTYAAYQFFRNGYPAAGAITASLEMGWYFGGINGAGIEANAFNSRLYEGVSKKILLEHACFPVLMFETSF
jgi:hypothetical protein